MYALTINQLYKTYKNNVIALKGIDLEVKQGDCFALLGPNGAGKSTTIGILTSLIQKTSGQVKIFGVNIDQNFSKAKSYLGVVPQEFNFAIFETVEQIVIKQAGFYGITYSVAKKQAEFFLKKLGLWDKRNQQARFLSGGMKRRLMIARALIHKPKLLILDEPTASVDVELRRSMLDFIQTINEQGTTIILTTHYLEEAERLCKNVAMIDKGKIILQGAMTEVLKQLQKETFILNLMNPLTGPLNCAPYTIRQPDPFTIEVDLYKDQTLNEIFTCLSNNQVLVRSLRNKANRLEELFVGLTSYDKAYSGHRLVDHHAQ